MRCICRIDWRTWLPRCRRSCAAGVRHDSAVCAGLVRRPQAHGQLKLCRKIRRKTSRKIQRYLLGGKTAPGPGSDVTLGFKLFVGLFGGVAAYGKLLREFARRRQPVTGRYHPCKYVGSDAGIYLFVKRYAAGFVDVYHGHLLKVSVR